MEYLGGGSALDLVSYAHLLSPFSQNDPIQKQLKGNDFTDGTDDAFFSVGQSGWSNLFL